MKNANKSPATKHSSLFEVEPEASLAEALATMLRHRIHHLVVKRDDDVLGVLSYRSCLEAQRDHGFANLRDLKAVDAISNEIPAVDDRFNLRQALSEILERGQTAILVRERDGAVRIVTETDLLRALDRLVKHSSPTESALKRIEMALGQPLVQVFSKFLSDAGI